MANPAAWSVFHDGYIAGVSGQIPGNVAFIIEAEYLRRRFADAGTAFRLCVTGCESILFKPFDANEAESGLESLMSHDLEILSASQAGDSVEVITVSGTMVLRYREEVLALDTGRLLLVSDVAAAANRALSEDEGFG